MITPSRCFPKSSLGSLRGLLFNSDTQIMQGWKGNFLRAGLFQTTKSRLRAPEGQCCPGWPLSPIEPGGSVPCAAGNRSAGEEALWSFLFPSVCISKQFHTYEANISLHVMGLSICLLACLLEGLWIKESKWQLSFLITLSVLGFFYTRRRLYNFWHLLSILQLFKKKV